MANPSAADEARLRAAVALMSGNPSLLAAAERSDAALLDDELRAAVVRARASARAGGGALVALASLLPVRLQQLAQRVALANPRVARAILRRTGVHHQLF